MVELCDQARRRDMGGAAHHGAVRAMSRVDCERCGRDDVPSATGEWFVERGWCRACETNYEPPEPDGEDFRGGEAAAFQREQMAEWQRLK